MRPFESDTLMRPPLLGRAKQKYLFLEEHLDPFSASALDRCTVVLMLWHFHKEMDVVGSIRQSSDIYIGKNGCCWAREKRKEVGEEQWDHLITPSTLMLLDSHFAAPAEVLRWYMECSLHTICNFSPQRNQGDDISQCSATNTGEGVGGKECI